MPAFCRTCFATGEDWPPGPCPACGHHRVARHPELFTLTIAHVDCDAFYASVEKRDRPELANRPLIIGGGRRGVVTTACYIARIKGVRSAMPMFKALAACPDAVVLKPDIARYVRESRRIRALMEELTPLVQPLSIDEAVLDLSGTAALHRAPPAVVMARFAARVEAELGLTVSVGLAPNRLLAKIAAGRDKPRGFAVIGRAEAAGLLAPEPVGLLPGVGPALVARLAARGITTLGQLQELDEARARRMLGEDGLALVAHARGEDARRVDPGRAAKSVSTETTFENDIADARPLERALWLLAEKLARRLDEKDLAAAGVVLKLRTERFVLRTRALRLPSPTRLPEVLFDATRELLAREVDGRTRFRLIGIGAQPLARAEMADLGDLSDPDRARRVAAQRAVSALRARFGAGVIGRGRGLQADPARATDGEPHASGRSAPARGR